MTKRGVKDGSRRKGENKEAKKLTFLKFPYDTEGHLLGVTFGWEGHVLKVVLVLGVVPSVIFAGPGLDEAKEWDGR